MAHDENKTFETEVIERLTKIEAMLEHDYDILHGSQNSPGLIATVSNHETRILTLETVASQSHRDWHTIAVVVAFLIQSVISLVSAFVK